MRFKDRDALEEHGRLGAKVQDLDDHYLIRVLECYWLAISKSDDGLTPHIYDGFWEPWIMLWISNNVHAGMKCADLGANVGYFTYQMAELGADVDAFEPNPATYELLNSVRAVNQPYLDGITRLYNKAVSTLDNLEFKVPRNNPMNASFYRTVHSPNGEDVVQVETVNKIGVYDFIKIDIEGGEEDVFSLLNPNRHPLVLMEFRWDRYEDPDKFAQAIFDKYKVVGYVTNNGSEKDFRGLSDLKYREHEDWMLVLRA